MSTAIDDDLEGEARSPTRRDGRIIAMPAEPIPAEVNAAFFADLAFERTLSMARGLASGFSGSTEPPAEARRAVVRRRRGCPGLAYPQQSTNPKRQSMNTPRNSNFTLATFPLSAAHMTPLIKRRRRPT
jgi:hypothetical protein